MNLGKNGYQKHVAVDKGIIKFTLTKNKRSFHFSAFSFTQYPPHFTSGLPHRSLAISALVSLVSLPVGSKLLNT